MALMEAAQKCRTDRGQIMTNIRECQDKLNDKKIEIEGWRKQETVLQREFTQIVGENSPFL